MQKQIDIDLRVAYDLLNQRKLRWCSGGICACMGCANREISHNQWKRIEQIPEIKIILDQRRLESQANMNKLLEHIRDGKL